MLCSLDERQCSSTLIVTNLKLEVNPLMHGKKKKKLLMKCSAMVYFAIYTLINVVDKKSLLIPNALKKFWNIFIGFILFFNSVFCIFYSAIHCSTFGT